MLQTQKRHLFRAEPPRMANYSEFPVPRANDKQQNYWQRLVVFFDFQIKADIEFMFMLSFSVGSCSLRKRISRMKT